MDHIVKCPQCEIGEVCLQEGKYGEFYSCSTYPTCDFTMNFDGDETFEESFYKKYAYHYENASEL